MTLTRRDSLLAMTALSAIALGASAADTPLPRVSCGRIERLRPASRHVDPRPVDVWLPEGYDPARRRYDVLYMHDGQMLFDPDTTWNRQAWRVHEALDRLLRAEAVRDTLVVGIWNNGPWRHAEYHPQRALADLPEAVRERYVREALHGDPRADRYLRFLVEELKPLIDARYATRPEPAHTHVMGASMGGLASVYALCEFPQVFGGAAGLSTHWIGRFEPNAALPLAGCLYLQRHLPPPAGHRLYQDHGDQELDALYAPYQPMVDAVVRERGYGGAEFMSRVFPGTGHNETAWAERLAQPLRFLLAP